MIAVVPLRQIRSVPPPGGDQHRTRQRQPDLIQELVKAHPVAADLCGQVPQTTLRQDLACQLREFRPPTAGTRQFSPLLKPTMTVTLIMLAA